MKQQDHTDCGVVCLQSLVRYYKGDISLELLREYSGTNTKGTSLLGLWEAAHKIGFNADGCEADIDSLKKHGKPTILHVVLDNNLQHYVIYFGEKKGKAIVGDPATGIKLLTYKQLDSLWKSKRCLTIELTSNFIQNQKISQIKSNWIKQLISEDLKILASSSFIGIMMSILGLSTVIFNQVLVDDILPNKDFDKLYLGIWLLCILLIVKVLFGFIRGWILAMQQKNFQIRIISSFFAQLLSLPKSFFDTRKKGDLLARLNDTIYIQKFIKQFAGVFIIEFLLLLSSLLFLFIYDYNSGLITISVIPIYVGLILILKDKISTFQQDAMIGFSESQSNYVDSLSGIEIIKNHGLTNTYVERNLNIYSKYQQKVLNLNRFSLKLNLITGSAGVFYLILIILNAAHQVIIDEFTLGQFVAVFTIASGIIPLTSHLTFIIVEFKEAEVAFNRMFELMRYKDNDKNGDIVIESFNSLRVKNLKFRYPGSSLIIRKLNLVITKGKITALLGENGCGKSTLLDIIQGFYKYEDGAILINDIPLADIDKNKWIKKIGIVPQGTHIFNNTLFYNITNQEPNENNVILFNNFIDEFGFESYFDQFPEHIFTLVGENGISLSGGQAQFVSFMRALYNNPELLILDEFTSAMDPRSEKLVFKSLRKIKCNTGILLVTHRIHILKGLADEINIMENGKILHKGNHESLVANENFYSSYWQELLKPTYV